MMSLVWKEAVRILNESAIYLLAGFALAGLLHVLLGQRKGLMRRLAGRGIRPVFLAALFGLPLPICSCGVLPVGLALRREGASKGTTASFLVSVPETDVVSVLLTYGLLGPVMAIFRPLAALVTAIVAGLVVHTVDGPPADGENAPAEVSGGDTRAPRAGWLHRALHYGFVEFFDDVIVPLLLGIVIAAALAALVPVSEMGRFAQNPVLAYAVMLVVGVPMYVCASASTPIAAALIATGISPGAALVFLLTGPATNVASLMVLRRYFGRAALAGYLASIAVVSVLMGIWLDAIVAGRHNVITLVGPAGATEAASPIQIGGTILFLALSVLAIGRRSRAWLRKPALAFSSTNRKGRRE